MMTTRVQMIVALSFCKNIYKESDRTKKKPYEETRKTNFTWIHNKHSMTLRNKTSLNKEFLIKRWQRQLLDRTHISFHEFMHLLRQQVRINSQISSSFYSFNIYETWSFVWFYFFSVIVGDVLLLFRSWFKRVTFWIWMDWFDI